MLQQDTDNWDIAFDEFAIAGRFGAYMRAGTAASDTEL